jgi:hypothetical protein
MGLNSNDPLKESGVALFVLGTSCMWGPGIMLGTCTSTIDILIYCYIALRVRRYITNHSSSAIGRNSVPDSLLSVRRDATTASFQISYPLNWKSYRINTFTSIRPNVDCRIVPLDGAY